MFFFFLFLFVRCVFVCAAISDHRPVSLLQGSKTQHFGNSTTDSPYWLAEISHRGKAPFHVTGANSSFIGENSSVHANSTGNYSVFRNVKNYGAKGNGFTDDTAAINLAISSGNRCAPGVCQSSTTTPAIVYFPSGTYRISSPIIDYYFTQIIGNPNNLPVLKATVNFSANAIIDGNPYLPGNADHPAGFPGWQATNVFYRQIRNLVINITDVSHNLSVQCIHWPTSQATSLQNIHFLMSQAKGTQHQGIFIEEGSGGFMSDLTFNGGQNAASFGNQQFTVRNFVINNANNAINMIWDWGWTFQSIKIKNCSVGLNITNESPTSQTVGSALFIDSSISNTPIGILTSHRKNATFTNGSLALENIQLDNVRNAVQGLDNTTLLAGTRNSGPRTIAAWAQGRSYDRLRPKSIAGPISPFARPQALLDSSTRKFYTRSKPQYDKVPVSRFMSAHSQGATGDGKTDDTKSLQRLFTRAASSGKIVFLDSGVYRITRTLYVPRETKIVGEAYPLILSSGPFFAKMSDPQPVVQVGKQGEKGCVELSDFVVGTQGPQAGAVGIEWNLVSEGTPSGMWDVHVRIGGFAGSKLQLADCAATPESPSVNEECIGAHTSMHVTAGVRGLYMENVWLWTADHDLDDPVFKNITVYNGRGLNMQAAGEVWLVGTSVEHHTLYQYQLSNTRNIFLGQMQSETAYYQPSPSAPAPFTSDRTLLDPPPCSAKNGTGQCSGWGFRILDSQDIGIYGAGLYSFFNNYNNSCSFPQFEDCQRSIFSIEGSSTRNVGVFGLNTVGVTSMVDVDGRSVMRARDNRNVFPDGVIVFRR